LVVWVFAFLLILKSTLELESNVESLKVTKAEKRRLQTIASMKKAKTQTTKTLMARHFKIHIFVDDVKAHTVAKFDAKDVKKPMDGKEKGWYMNFEKPETALQNCCLKKADKDKHFIPYRRINGEFKPNRMEGSASFITTTYQYEPGKIKNLKFQFEFDKDWDYISKEELQMLCGWLNDLRVARQSLVKDLKKKTLEQANFYMANKTSYDAAQKGGDEVKKQLETSTELVKTLTAKNETLVKDVNNTMNEVLEFEKQLSIKTKERNDANAKATQLAAQFQTTGSNIKELELLKAKGKADQEALKQNVEAAKNGFDAILKELKEEYSVGKDYEPLENARKAVFDGEKPDIMRCNGNLFEAYPLT